ncbi:MAG: hypothetical protein ABFS21_11370 [Actinomycetota bacterium]
MRRVGIALAIAAVVIAMAAPAAAKKPVPTEPARYDVEMTFSDSAPGLSTACEGGGTISMLGDAGSGTLSLWDTDTPSEAAAIHVRAPELAWERRYPTYSTGIGFDECHGPSVYDGPDHPFSEYGGALTITIDDEAGTVGFRWHFDYYIDAEDLGVKKARWVATVREHYTMEAIAAYDTETGLVSGSFPFSWYLKEDRTLIKDYEPMGGAYLEFYLAVSEAE